jgi:hypothetical protein
MFHWTLVSLEKHIHLHAAVTVALDFRHKFFSLSLEFNQRKEVEIIKHWWCALVMMS